MKTHFDIEKIIDDGCISNELDYERALIADRKLRLLAKENSHFKTLRKKLRNLIELYENAEWSNVEQLDHNKLFESDNAERLAEIERLFVENRKLAIRKKLKELHLKQEDLAILLGHKSKTHISELINGIKPFTLKDLIIIKIFFKIDLEILIPTFLSHQDYIKVREAIQKLNKPLMNANFSIGSGGY
jgi:antitoxin component HigA of HigAB toxin-antitoxin module